MMHFASTKALYHLVFKVEVVTAYASSNSSTFELGRGGTTKILFRNSPGKSETSNSRKAYKYFPEETNA
jgi:hypothetical protein